MRKTVAILGIPIDDLDMNGVLDRIDSFIASGKFHQVATANVDFLVKANHDQELKRILRTSDMIVPDGMPLVWASKWLKSPLQERVTGVDLVHHLAIGLRQGLTADQGIQGFHIKPLVALVRR